MEHPDLVEVYTTNDANEAEILKIALGNEGIDSAIDGEHQAGLTGILTIRLLVRSEDEDRALAVLEQHRYRHESE